MCLAFTTAAEAGALAGLGLTFMFNLFSYEVILNTVFEFSFNVTWIFLRHTYMTVLGSIICMAAVICTLVLMTTQKNCVSRDCPTSLACYSGLWVSLVSPELSLLTPVTWWRLYIKYCVYFIHHLTFAGVFLLIKGFHRYVLSRRTQMQAVIVSNDSVDSDWQSYIQLTTAWTSKIYFSRIELHTW